MTSRTSTNNGKLFHGESQQKLYIFRFGCKRLPKMEISVLIIIIGNVLHGRTRDEITRFVKWYNNDRPHMSPPLIRLLRQPLSAMPTAPTEEVEKVDNKRY